MPKYLELNNITYFINEYFDFLNKINHTNNYVDKYYDIINNIAKYEDLITNYIYNINIDIYINFCKNHNIYNINHLFKENITQIRLIKENIGGLSDSIILKCLYNNKPSIIKIFYNPFINLDKCYSLFYEQLVNFKIKKYQNEPNSDQNSKFLFPEIYEVGFIELDYLLNNELKNEIYDLINDIWNEELIEDQNMKTIFDDILKILLENNTNINKLNDSSYKFRLFKKYNEKSNIYWIKLLLFFLNIKNKLIHVSIVEDLNKNLNKLNIIEIYNELNFINKKNNKVDFDNDFYIILYQIFYGLYLLNDKMNIIHNDLHLENIIITKNTSNKYRCSIIDFNLSYINNEIYNIGIIKRYDDGIQNIFNKSYDLFVFLTFFGTICNYMHTNFYKYNECTLMNQTYNLFTYNHNNYKYLNKILFKKNDLLHDIVCEHIILYLNQKIKVPVLIYKFHNEINNLGTAYNMINNKYLLKKLKKINYNIN